MALVTSLPIPNGERKARLAIRIADSITKMGLSVNYVNACVRIGMVCMDNDYTLIGAYSHAVKVARRILQVKEIGGRS
jgi:hypothetical protein